MSEDAGTVAKSTQPALASPTGDAVLPMLLSLLLIMAVIFAVAWAAKKLNLTPNNTGHFKLVSSMSLGGRERMVIIEVQGQQHALGVTSQSVNHLFQLDKNIEPARQPMANNALLQRLNKVFGYTPPGGAVKSNE